MNLQDLKIRFHVIFFPFVITLIALVCGYGLLRWLLDIQLQLPIKEDLWNFWMPFGIAYFVAFLVFRKRVKILKIKEDKTWLVIFLMGIFIAVTIFLSQDYLITNAYKLVTVNSVEDANALKPEKYYKISNYQLSKQQAVHFVNYRTSGKNNETLNFNLYFAVPFQTDTNTPVQSVPQIWYGVKYEESMGNSASNDEKTNRYNSFIDKSVAAFAAANLYEKTSYFQTVPYSDDKDGYFEAIQKAGTTVAAENKMLILTPETEAFEARSGVNGKAFYIASGISMLLVLLVCLFVKTDPEGVSNYSTKKTDDSDASFLKSMLLPSKELIAPLLIDINILVFIFMVLTGVSIVSPTTKELLHFGGNRRTEVLNGEYWRLLTSTFVHSGIMHILMNMFSLYLTAVLLEPVIKKWWLMGSYLFTGIVASLASIWWHPATVSVGASGAIFGLFGFTTALLLTKSFPAQTNKAYWLIIGTFAGINLVLGFLSNGTDNAAHIGGLISGIIVGFVFYLLNKERLQEMKLQEEEQMPEPTQEQIAE